MIANQKNIRHFFSFLALILIFAACSGGGNMGKKAKTSHEALSFDTLDAVQPWQPSKRHSIPVVMNPGVKKWIKAFNGPLKSHFTKWMYRLGQYGPTIESILKKEHAPVDLIYLSMIESGFNLKARSSASAAGPWQFMSATGRMYGLNNDFFVDDRSNLIQATEAAATHLKDLYKVYGDWYLAFAAYNAGPGKVNRAVKRGKTTDYWRLCASKGLFRQETRDYVPKFLAALHIVKNYRQYGYTSRSFGPPLLFDKVTVPDATDVEVIAKSSRTSVEHIQKLNPSLVMGITPPGKQHEIYIPKGAKQEFQRRYAEVPASKRVSYLNYRSAHKETVATVAKKYNVSASEIAKLNGFDSKQKLKSGTLVKIPATKGTLLAMAKGGTVHASKGKSGTSIAYYRVKKGDTLGRVAHKNKTTTGQIALWNKLGKKTKLRVGQQLKIYKKGRGETHYASSGLFAPSYSGNAGATGRVTGVKRIILRDEELPVAFRPTSAGQTENIDFSATEGLEDAEAAVTDIPVMTATVDAPEVDKPQKPAMVRDVTGTILADLEKETVDLNVADNTDNTGQTDIPDVADTSLTKAVTETATARYHKVRPGENLSVVAKKYKTTVAQLTKLNKLGSSHIRIGQKLLLTGEKNATTRKTQTTQTTVAAVSKPLQKNKVGSYTVRPKDTLIQIALKHGVKVADIKAWNNLATNNIRSGQKLMIAGKAQQKTKSTTVAAKQSTTKNKRDGYIIHHIRSGETLWSLSKRYGVKISDIKKWNRLQGNSVKPKQKIKILAMLKTTGKGIS
ncbi:MAG: LysM peptidoglycan-binding domain-containing protein [Deltaproteobacteria bacterium]|nr:LysM peptidoglycan-binding domain-containing protein [Deltaproteobacteria bacterium]